MRTIQLLLVLVALPFSSPAQQQEWREAKARNTIEAYEQFAVAWSNSDKVSEAFERRCELFKQQLAARFSMDLIRQQLLPGHVSLLSQGLVERGACHTAILAQYEEAAFAETMSSDSPLNATLFALWWPGSRHLGAVSEHAYELAVQANTLLGYSRFASNFPASARAAEAMDRYCQLRVQQLVAVGQPRSALVEFLQADSCKGKDREVYERLRTIDEAQGIDASTTEADIAAKTGGDPENASTASGASGAFDSETIVLEDDVVSVRHLEMTLHSGRSLHFMSWASPLRDNYQLGNIQSVVFRFADGDSLHMAFTMGHNEQVVSTMGGRAPIMRTALWNALSIPDDAAAKFKATPLVSVDMIDAFDKGRQERELRGHADMQTLRLSKRDQRLVMEGSARLW